MFSNFVIFKLSAYLLAPFYLATLLWRGRGERGAWRGLAQRFGFGTELPAPVWLHAASAGEVQAAAVLVTALRQRDQQLPLLVTATTAAGLARARTLFEAQSVAVRYLPLDLPGSVRRFLQRVRPQVALVLETEIWPNLIRACANAQVPVMFVSARLSARSARRYRRLGNGMRRVLGTVAQVAAQTTADAQRFADLCVQPARIEVTGNLKTDFTVPDIVAENGARLRASLGPQRPVWVAGSTHEHEEQQVLAAHPAPAGIRVEIGGQYAGQQEAFRTLLIVLVLAVHAGVLGGGRTGVLLLPVIGALLARRGLLQAAQA